MGHIIHHKQREILQTNILKITSSFIKQQK